MKAKFDKLDFNKLANVPNALNNLKTKVEDLNVDKLKTVHIVFQRLSDVVSKEVVKNTKFNKLNTKVNNLEKKISDAIL